MATSDCIVEQQRDTIQQLQEVQCMLTVVWIVAISFVLQELHLRETQLWNELQSQEAEIRDELNKSEGQLSDKSAMVSEFKTVELQVKLVKILFFSTCQTCINFFPTDFKEKCSKIYS